LIGELREEIRSVLSQNGGVLTSAALQSMKKMDSVLKETLRLHPPNFGMPSKPLRISSSVWTVS